VPPDPTAVGQGNFPDADLTGQILPIPMRCRSAPFNAAPTILHNENGDGKRFFCQRTDGVQDPMDGRLKVALSKTVRTKKETEAHYSA
jgi:hypothetical protein